MTELGLPAAGDFEWDSKRRRDTCFFHIKLFKAVCACCLSSPLVAWVKDWWQDRKQTLWVGTESPSIVLKARLSATGMGKLGVE